jgi:hypothetical protein
MLTTASRSTRSRKKLIDRTKLLKRNNNNNDNPCNNKGKFPSPAWAHLKKNRAMEADNWRYESTPLTKQKPGIATKAKVATSTQPVQLVQTVVNPVGETKETLVPKQTETHAVADPTDAILEFSALENMGRLHLTAMSVFDFLHLDDATESVEDSVAENESCDDLNDNPDEKPKSIITTTKQSIFTNPWF